MSYAQDTMKAALARLSNESDAGSQGDLVDLDTEILSEAGEDQGELVALSSEINTVANATVAMEGLVERFRARKNHTAESVSDFTASFEAVILASNLKVDGGSITPSFESDKTDFEYSVEAEEKSENFLQKAYAWIVAKLKQLAAIVKRIFTRAKAVEGSTAAKADAAVTALEAGEITTEAHVSLPAAYAKWLVDANGRPVGLQKAIGLALKPMVIAYQDKAIKAIQDKSLPALNAASKAFSTPVGVGSSFVGTPGSDKDNPAVGFTIAITTPAPNGTPEFPVLGKGEVVRGLKTVSEYLKTGRTSKAFEELEKDIQSTASNIEKAVSQKQTGRSKEAQALRSAVASYVTASSKAGSDGFQLLIKTHLAILAYAKALKA